jgi:Fe-S cluster assembly ATP-binding protein
MHTLQIKDLHVKVNEKEILKGINLTINSGETHVIMGPNGVGKSTLSNVIMGNPSYEVTQGSIYFDGKDLKDITTDERARLGIFLSFQSPVELDGVTTADFLKTAVSIKEKENFKMLAFAREVDKNMQKLNINKDFLNRSLNSGFSGGEKKKMEILSMYMLKPDMVILDEIDSGLDVDSLRTVGCHVEEYKKESNCGILLITHYEKLLEYITPEYVHVIKNGVIVKEGDKTLVDYILENGYENI